MQAATMTAPLTMADRLLAFGDSLPASQRSILTQMVAGGRSRLARPASQTSRLSAADAEILLADKAKGNADNDSAWKFDIWKFQF